MSHKSDIGICEFRKGEISVNINGWSICDIIYDDDILIKNKDDAVEIAKGIVSLLEFKYGKVKNEDYPNRTKAPYDVWMVEGYEVPAHTEEETQKILKEMESEVPDFLKLLMEMGECE